MNKQIRRLALGLLVCYVILFVQLNIIQVGREQALMADVRNNRLTTRDFNRPRGPIVTADGTIIAQSVPSPGGAYKYQRVYPTNDLFANVTGYYTFGYGSTQLEKTQDAVLMGDTDAQKLKAISGLFRGENTGSVVLTLRHDVQQLAAQQIGDREGSAVVLDPKTGAVLAMVNNPRFNPNDIAGVPTKKAGEVLTLLNLNPSKPLLDRTYQERYMPGSAFKVITTATALSEGVTSLERSWPSEKAWTPPQTTKPVGNYGGSSCGGTMAEVFYRSCNIPFAQMAIELGPGRMVNGTKAWGIGEKVPIDLPAPAASYFGDAANFTQNLPLLAIGGFGQGDDTMVPMQMAMVAATVANGGVMMKPYVIAASLAHDGSVLTQTTPEAWKTPISAEVATTLTTLMIGVVNQGTGRQMQLANGVQAAAKTGTAQLFSDGPEKSNAWIIGFAPADSPRYAVAVMLKGGVNDEISAGTGGKLAGPIAKVLLDHLLATETPAAPPASAP